MKSVAKNVVIELEYISEQAYSNPFKDIKLDVVFFDPDGNKQQVPAFWAGGNIWKVRYASVKIGQHKYQSKCSDKNNLNLHKQKGVICVHEYNGKNPFFKHGRLQVAASRRTLEHADGTPFLWLADTWWCGLSKRLKWPEDFQMLVKNRVAKGFNVIQIVAGFLPNCDADTQTWDNRQNNEGGSSWIKSATYNNSSPPVPADFISINPHFFDFVDLRLEYMLEAGLMPCIVSMWAYYLSYLGINNVKEHWRYLVARYGAYPVILCLCGEILMPNYSVEGLKQREVVTESLKEKWSKVAKYVRKLDQFHNVMTAHPNVILNSKAGENILFDVRDMLEDDTAIDLNMLQTGHEANASYLQTLNTAKKSYLKRPVMPFLNGEVNYEGIMGGNWQDVQRFLFWTHMLSGACGHTYGAQGLWGMSSRNESSESIWGEGCWEDAIHYSGSTQVGLGAKFLRRYKWQDFIPREEKLPAGRNFSYAAGIPYKVAMYYFPAYYIPWELKGMSGVPITILPGESFSAFWFNPQTGKVIEIGIVKPNKEGKWLKHCLKEWARPTLADLVLVLEASRNIT